MKVIIGLGNPGKNYDNTRHNVGFAAIDKLSEEFGIKLIKAKHKALTGDAVVGGEKLMLVKPMTFMNLSGESVGEIRNFYKLDLKDIIIIYDDASLLPGSIRIRENGSDGGHNGMKSIIAHLGSSDFIRIRIGIGEVSAGYDLADYVLSKIKGDEKTDIMSAIEKMPECVKLIIGGTINDAMNKYNRRGKQPEQTKEREISDERSD